MVHGRVFEMNKAITMDEVFLASSKHQH